MPVISYLDHNFQLCDAFNVKPIRICFFIELPRIEAQEKCFYIKNKTSDVQIVTLGPPITEFFEMPYFGCNERQISSEKSLEVSVKFHSQSEVRPYYDRIKVTCSKGCEVYVRLIASPVIKDMINIPLNINFGTVPIGETSSYKIKIPVLKNKVPFLFLGTIYNPDVTITPTKGTVVKAPKVVTICYTPKAYFTLYYPVHLYLPTLSALPMFFIITAETKPGALSEMIYKKDENAKVAFTMKMPFLKHQQSSKQPLKPPKDMEWSQHKTNLFLIKKDKEVVPKYELRGPYSRYMNEEEEIKKLKQKNFLKDVIISRKAYSEPLNHRRTVLRELKVAESNEWDLIWKDYEVELSNINDATQYEKRPQILRQRIIGPVVKIEKLQFTQESPNLWFIRRLVLNRFIEVVRRIIVKNRLLKRLEFIKIVCDNLKAEECIRQYKNA